MCLCLSKASFLLHVIFCLLHIPQDFLGHHFQKFTYLPFICFLLHSLSFFFLSSVIYFPTFSIPSLPIPLLFSWFNNYIFPLFFPASSNIILEAVLLLLHSSVLHKFYIQLALPISPEIMDRFWCSRCLNDRIKVPDMMRLFAGGATTPLVVKIWTKQP